MEPDTIKHMIETGLPGGKVQVQGDGSHFEALVISDEFEGKNTLTRHRMVYATLGDNMQSAIHALSMRTLTNAEWLTAQQG
ncbi:MAG: BolA/IbaG family iron-sulfur metabolism protein [Gammaproteobacteria bacterium]